MAQRIRSERGAATFVVVAVMAVVISLAVAGLVLGGYLVAEHRAQQAADLAALGGAVEFERGGSVCARARTVAVANGGRLLSCSQVGDQLDFVVTARVRVSTGWSRLAGLPGLPSSVEAVAYAGAMSS